MAADTVSKITEESVQDKYNAFVRTLIQMNGSPYIEEECDPVEQKVAHLSNEYATEVKHLLQGYAGVIAYSFDDV